jgi:hypothetical protein
VWASRASSATVWGCTTEVLHSIGVILSLHESRSWPRPPWKEVLRLQAQCMVSEKTQTRAFGGGSRRNRFGGGTHARVHTHTHAHTRTHTHTHAHTRTHTHTHTQRGLFSPLWGGLATNVATPHATMSLHERSDRSATSPACGTQIEMGRRCGGESPSCCRLRDECWGGKERICVWRVYATRARHKRARSE